ncbi:maleylacetate reductase [Paradevosia shaoguanensis]|uniref:maleylacetate reductase n=1 Tax=Paradevosia shaoguanensis TaxID=1335043 RepID=UPI003C71F3A7
MPFRAHSHEQTVIFGEDHRSAVAQALEGRHGFIVTTPGHKPVAEALAAELRQATICALARMHTPVAVTEEALGKLAASGAKQIVAIGGGSAIGLGKALALRTGLEQIVVPTTYAGSEMTPVLGQTENGRKTTLRDERVRPGTVIYDVGLTLTLPPDISAASGMNGLAHAVEALYAPDRAPLSTLAAQRAIHLFGASLPAIARDPADRAARERALEAAYLAGFALGQTTMGLHHKLAHVLGGMLDLPHAQTHAALLPHVARFNAASLVAVLGSDPGRAIAAIGAAGGAPTSLRALGMAESDIERVIPEVLGAGYANPRAVSEDDLRALLRAAWAGSPT